MPKSLSRKFWFSLHELPDGDLITIPIFQREPMWLNQSEYALAHKLAQQFNSIQAESGQYLDILYRIPDISLNEMDIQVKFEKSSRKLYPAIELSFRIYYSRLPINGYIGYVPILGLSSYGSDMDKLINNMRDNIRLDFSRTEKLKSVKEIISTQWYNDESQSEVPVELTIYSITELRNLAELKKEKLLPKVARKMEYSTKSAYYLDDELDGLHNALFGKFRRSVLLVGPSGVGKTALINEFLYQKNKNNNNGIFWQTNASTLINKLTGTSGWKDNLTTVCKELRDELAFLYIENFADLFEVGQYVGSNVSIADHLQEFIKRGDITIISECTDEELAAIDVRSQDYSSLFHIIRLTEPPVETLHKIIEKSSQSLVHNFRLEIDPVAIEEALRLQKRFTPYAGFPGKTIRFLESVFIEQRKRDKNIDRSTIIDAFCQETGMPRFLIDPGIDLPLNEMQAHFKKNIFGQEEAVETVVDMIMTVKAFLAREGKPIASLLFIGPTGVGKTEMAKVLAEYVFGNRKRVIRFDMSEYSDSYSVLRLTGDSYSEKGLLVDAIRRDPFSVVLFDELEKAHYSFYDLLLQILGEGRLTDAKGNVADFCSTIIIMTSNIGARTYKRSQTGFTGTRDTLRGASRHFEREVQKYFRPELFNRLDRIVSFLSLDQKTIRYIVDREIETVKKREGLYHREITIDITDKVLDHLSVIGYDSFYGARQLQRAIRKHLIIPLSKNLNNYDRKTPVNVRVAMENDSISISVEGRGISKIHETIGSHEFTLTEFANAVTDSRREMQRVENGVFFVELMSDYDILIMKKKKRGSKFYSDSNLVDNYYKVQKLINHINGIFQNIYEYEYQAVRSYFGITEIDESLLSDYSKRQDAFEQSKLSLYKYHRPADANIIIAIYGSDSQIDKILDIYVGLLKHRKNKFNIRSVWLADGDYTYRKGNQAIHTLNTDHQFLGYQLEVIGDGAFLYFRSESGLQTVIDGDNRKHKYMIVIKRGNYQSYSTPHDVHRKSFFESLKGIDNRRTYSKFKFEDKKYKLVNSEVSDSKSILSILAGYLDDKFNNQLMQIVCNGYD